MDLLELIQWLINGTFDLFLHFVYSGLAALLAFYLMWWAIRGMYFTLASLSHSETSMPTALARSMRRLGWLAALFCSLTAHLWWDRLLGPF